MGKRIRVPLQQRLLDERGRLVDDLEAQLNVAVYLPSSGAYDNIPMPGDVPSEEVVKLVGSTQEACNEARDILEVNFVFHCQVIRFLILAQHWVRTQVNNMTPTKFDIPAVLYGPIKLKIERRYNGAVRVDTTPPENTQSFTSLLSDIAKSGTGWSIYRRDEDIRFARHKIRLAAITDEYLALAGKFVQNLTDNLTWRIGVLQLEPDHILNLKPKLELQNETYEELYFDVQESSRQATITGNAFLIGLFLC
jgi:hypothetical protein